MKFRSDMTTTIELELPKISLNDWYAGKHWTERKQIKDAYKIKIGSIVKEKFDAPCTVTYRFEFKSRPLDCSNCMAMVKMIEDSLFPDDGVKIVKQITISSEKSNRDLVTVAIIPEILNRSISG
jgi:hypothetical protein